METTVQKLSDLDVCPICGRTRSSVSTPDGYQVALGRRTSCMECGPQVIEQRDARWRASHRADCQEVRPDPLGAAYRAKYAELKRLNELLLERQERLAATTNLLVELEQVSIFRRLWWAITRRY